MNSEATQQTDNYFYEALESNYWSHPENYGGFSPDGDVCVVGRSRDSSILENTNYELIIKELSEFNEQYPAPVNEALESGDMPYVYDFRQSHWAVGWVETLMVRQDAPSPIMRRTLEIITALDDYPVYSDDAYSEARYEAMHDMWEGYDDDDKAEWYELAREPRPDEMPDCLSDAPNIVQMMFEDSEMFY